VRSCRDSITVAPREVKSALGYPR